MKRICIVTDAWHPQVNGVVTTLNNVVGIIKDKVVDDNVDVVHPGLFPNYPFPFYKSIRFAIPIGFSKYIDRYRPNYIHIATEGPLGISAVIYCMKRGIPFTTSFHTDFSYYLKKHYFIPRKITWSYLRTFHWMSQSILVPNSYTASMLHKRNFDNNVIEWTRGYDSNFKFRQKRDVFSERVHVYVGRVSKEKNLDDFGVLSDKLDGVFVVIGDGPYLNKMKKKYKNIIYCGSLDHHHIAEWLAKSDVFVFPSRFDTFGIVMLESMACGVPVVSYDGGAAKSIIVNGINGYTVESIDEMPHAIDSATKIDRQIVSRSVNDGKYTWERAYRIFMETIVKVNESV